jgi:hypothetical protein
MILAMILASGLLVLAALAVLMGRAPGARFVPDQSE